MEIGGGNVSDAKLGEHKRRFNATWMGGGFKKHGWKTTEGTPLGRAAHIQIARKNAFYLLALLGDPLQWLVGEGGGLL